MKQFEGKVVLVTGGSRNTGLEIVDRRRLSATWEISAR